MQKLFSLLTAICAVALVSCTTVKKSSSSVRSQLTAQQFTWKSERSVKTGYLLYLPKDCDPKSRQRWPLMLFLHGAGERGTNLTLVAKHGPPKLAQLGTNFPFIIVAPQCPAGQVWDNAALFALLDHIQEKYPVDEKRIYVTGLSMGGYGTWSLAAARPEKFAAVAPICGGGNFIEIHLARGDALKKLGVWAFHGAKDPVVPPAESERMIDALKKIGAKDVQLTVYPEAQHDSWTETYADPKFYDWLLAHQRK